MSPNHTAAIEYWGFECPKGSKFYICENTWDEFFGCCGSDPCADDTGFCSHGLKALSFDRDKQQELRDQRCLPGYLYYKCLVMQPTFVGCCGHMACTTGCPVSQLGPNLLSPIESTRHSLLYPPSLNLTTPPSSKTPLRPLSALPPTSFRVSEYNAKSHRNPSLLNPQAVVGICSAILIATFVSLGLLIKYWNKSSRATNAQTYASIGSQEPGAANDNMRPSPALRRKEFIVADVQLTSGPRRLKQTTFMTYVVWVWNIVLTLVPMCFIALAIVVIDLDGRMKSSFGQRVLELTKLSPSLYPILFAAVAGRFYKNVARYCLEQSGGVRLAILEQVFGSQSFATAVERVFFVHTHMFLSVIILSTWALSPLGGQSSSRVLGFGNATQVANGTINYLHPAYQVSSYLARRSFVATKGSVAALYSSNLLSSLEQKRSPRDMWELPKIPQISGNMKKVGKTYMVDREALESGDHHYASLLGVKLRGLGPPQEATEHNFTVQTSYIDLDCQLTDDKFHLDTSYWDNRTTSDEKVEGSDVRVQAPVPWEEWKELDEPPPLELTYFIRWNGESRDDYRITWSAINCTMRTIWLETDIQCGPRPLSTSCYAYQQRQIKDIQHANRLPRLMGQRYGALQQALGFWPEASGDGGFDGPPATENYIMGELHPYAGQPYRNWTALDRTIFPKEVSKRLTTALNTFWDATLNPLGHTNVSFGALNSSSTAYEDEFNPEPFMNATVGTMTRTFEVYRASQCWVAILLTTTIFLQILAILGLILEAVIVGPEVLGFASSLTRNNRYVPVPPGNSAVGGAERARLFRDIRLQIADVEPGNENGYIAVHSFQSNNVEKASTDDSEEQAAINGVSGRVDTRSLIRERLYR